MRHLRLPLVAAALTASASFGSVSHAGWEEVNFETLDQSGAVGAHPDLEFETIDATAEKRNVLAYADISGGSLKVARRQTVSGQPLSGAPWSTDTVHSPFFTPYLYFHSPDVALDRVSGQAYVAYAGAKQGGTRYWLATEVEPGTGNCGGPTASWLCEDFTSACKRSDFPHSFAPGSGWVDWGPSVALESEASEETDVVHVFMVDLTPTTVRPGLHARKDLTTGTWTCEPIGGSAGNAAAWDLQAIAQRHEFHDRFKPTITYFQPYDWYVIRSLLEYQGTPWNTPRDIFLAPYLDEAGPSSLALNDEGLMTGQPTGFGLPAVATTWNIHVHGMEIRCEDYPRLYEYPHKLEYYLAADSDGSSWSSQTVYEGAPCAASLTFGSSRKPYIAFHDELTGEVMLTAHQHLWVWGGWFAPAESVALGINPSIAFDYDDDTIAIALYDDVAKDLVVVDGSWQY